MMKMLVVTMVLVAGAVQAATVVGTEKLDNGFINTLIDCSGADASWGDCFSEAKMACDGRGYSIVDKAERSREEKHSSTDASGKVTASSNEQVTRVLTVKCATR